MNRTFWTWIAVGLLGTLLCSAAPAKGALASEPEAGPGYLGVLLEAPGDGSGAVVRGLVPGSAAEKAGIQVNDRIVKAAGEAVAGPDDLRRAVQAKRAGESLAIHLERGNTSLELSVVLGAAPAQSGVGPASPVAPGEQEGETAGRAFLGIGFAPVHPEVAAHLGLAEGVGVTVGEVWEDSAAAKAGLRKGDILVAADGEELAGPESLVEHLAKRKPGDTLRLEVIHRGERKSVEATVGERPADLPQARFGAALPHAPGVFPWSPQQGRSGRIIIHGPNGTRQLFPLPEEFPDMDRFFKEMEEQFPDLGKLGSRDEMMKRFERIFDELRQDVPDRAEGSQAVTRSSASSVVRIADGTYDITVRDENGVRTVDAKKDGKTIAEGLPYSQIDSLPDDVRAKVEEAAEGVRVRVESGTTPAPAPPAPAPTTEGKELRA